MITALAVENYRSLRRLVLAVGRLNVVTGPNESGKSSLYRHTYRSRVAELCQPRGLSATREFSDDVDMWVRMRMEVKV